ncbi:unnamed protein product [Nezara viridula]|uniref:Uncharacterized protein n=1 Tax=Nezara viridula TaxID=85310 RepID=A0A9P0MKC7_NEZVI|nr:unnamed protein product [Nezara viridula]
MFGQIPSSSQARIVSLSSGSTCTICQMGSSKWSSTPSTTLNGTSERSRETTTNANAIGIPYETLRDAVRRFRETGS